jgi:hypothetical protein
VGLTAGVDDPTAIKRQFSQHPASSLIAIPTELSRLQEEINSNYVSEDMNYFELEKNRIRW